MFDPLVETSLTSQLMEIVQNPRLRADLNQVLGDYCHQCRNRLNSLKLSLYLAKRQSPQGVTSAWMALESDYQSVEAQLAKVETLCRPLCLSPVTIGLNLLFEDRRASWSKVLAEAGRDLEFHQPEEQSVARFDVDRLGLALDAMVAWRAEQGSSTTQTLVRWWVECNQAHVSWVEHSSQDVPDSVRLPDQFCAWTLPLLTRIVTEHGGSVEVDDRVGWSLKMSWPSEPT